MTLAQEYERQFAWRDWRAAFDALPLARGETVLDLGCGVGAQAAELASRGARVIGIDGNEELLAVARSRSLANAEFLRADLRHLPDLGLEAGGIWSSFAAAYFPDLSTVLASWTQSLRSGGWIALTEVDDLFAHEPLEGRTRELFESYVEDALAAKRHDFRMGKKLGEHLERAGLHVTRALKLEDDELSFRGAAAPEVLEAWNERFARMHVLRDFSGPAFERLRADFLACLARPDHRSRARVYCSIARKP